MTEINSYETIIMILKNLSNPKFASQYEQQLNRLPFFSFYKQVLKTNTFTQSASKYMQLLYLKKGQVYKHPTDSIESVIILLEGTLSLIKNDQKKQILVKKVKPPDHLFQAEIYKKTAYSKHKIIALTDCSAISLSFISIHEISVYGFQFVKHREEVDYFRTQYPDIKPIEFIPFIKQLRKENFMNNVTIYSSNQIANKVYFIISGEVEIYGENEDGKLQRIAIACENDSFGEEALSSSVPRLYKYTAKTQYFKKTTAFAFEIDDYCHTYAPNLIKKIEDKMKLKEQLILQKFKQTQTQTSTLPIIINGSIKKPFYQYIPKFIRFLNMASPASMAQSIKMNRAQSLDEQGLLNFMELHSPDNHQMRLFESQVIRPLIKQQQYDESANQSRDRTKSGELQKFWNLSSESKKLPQIKQH
ncbi:unnamed protein product (macronuclear) [Paramecium tetraurelia]|uniref:Cyclic nucleotide-binding domain-containing protein n=1 Tax=Paramecium tetraurelia TaxID=5888 RepID=A0BVR3_PARTE|nr:uncharacterized protein GSPATT00032482001 [Paramecium tetraurelia]CAK62630.1 unnamed protein product [Paramecium tetraurelia]|eukprot:XP_001430028.1 hypothetical protein (macronuclear) [Paramecium tetraurelia strain d4-2]